MKCSECNSITTTFDERMGETICDDCGLILSVDIFEETVMLKHGERHSDRSRNFSQLGSIISFSDVNSRRDSSNFVQNLRTTYSDSENNLMLSAGIYLSYYNGKKLLPEILKRFRIMKEEHLVRGLPIDNIAAGIVYYTLKDKGMPVSLKDFSKKSKIPIKNIMRTSKRVTRRFGKPHIFSHLNLDEIVNETIERIRVRQQTKVVHIHPRHNRPYTIYANNRPIFEDISSDMRRDCHRFAEYIKQCYDLFNQTFTRSDIIASIWFVGEIYNSQSISTAALAECGGVSEVTIRTKRRSICNDLNLDYDNIKLYTIENIINGVR